MCYNRAMLNKLENTLHPLFVPENSWNRPLRRVAVVLYLAFLTMLLLQSSAHPYVGPSAPKDFDLVWDLFLTSCHMLGFALLVVLIWGALVIHAPSRWALVVAVIFAVSLGGVSEVLQSLVPDRSASLDDFIVDWAITMIAALAIDNRQHQFSTPLQGRYLERA